LIPEIKVPGSDQARNDVIIQYGIFERMQNDDSIPDNQKIRALHKLEKKEQEYYKLNEIERILNAFRS